MRTPIANLPRLVAVHIATPKVATAPGPALQTASSSVPWQAAFYDLHLPAAIEAVGHSKQPVWYALDVVADIRCARAAANARRRGTR